MNIEEIREYCIAKKGSSESFPFDNSSLVIKVGSKMFALLSLNEIPQRLALKCEPNFAIELREEFSAVQPAFHFNKKHWNMIILNETISAKQLKLWIDHSYEMVMKGMTKKEQAEIANLH